MKFIKTYMLICTIICFLITEKNANWKFMLISRAEKSSEVNILRRRFWNVFMPIFSKFEDDNAYLRVRLQRVCCESAYPMKLIVFRLFH